MDLTENKPEDYRCARCKTRVEPTSDRWRMGLDGWEHSCPDNQHPQAGHCPSERIPPEAATG